MSTILTEAEQTQLMRAYNYVSTTVVPIYRRFPVHPRPDRTNLATIEALLATVDADKLTDMESLGEALGMDFYDGERMLRLKLLLNKATRENLAYVLGFDGPQMQKRVNEFERGCEFYTKLTHELTLMVLILRPIDTKLQNAMFALVDTINQREDGGKKMHLELFSIPSELQRDPFRHVMQSKQRIVPPDWLAAQGVEPSILPHELISYGISKSPRRSITAKLLGARPGDVIEHTFLSVANQIHAANTELRLVQQAPLREKKVKE